MINVETVELDGKTYMIVKDKKIDENEYVLLANTENPQDFIIQKIKLIDNEEYVVELDSEEEYNTAIEALVGEEILETEEN